ncbi:hypothetical protein NEOLEDRAFT_167940 [Neolentinus lepideus HHB14362 ss-1]|uniref:Uncharacterized protein n=1 Tax=Neolentinus lepideus HHB14362 ss-1 TaxID=1314782 RepID=A0A165MKW3_9AGAM|nr:hypothetical protein NEOLEDRAFT_167940 [Neolentinus lepideus HHB14362 ss-1]
MWRWSLFRRGSLWEGEPAFKLRGEAEIQVKQARASFKLRGRGSSQGVRLNFKLKREIECRVERRCSEDRDVLSRGSRGVVQSIESNYARHRKAVFRAWSGALRGIVRGIETHYSAHRVELCKASTGVVQSIETYCPEYREALSRASTATGIVQRIETHCPEQR